MRMCILTQTDGNKDFRIRADSSLEKNWKLMENGIHVFQTPTDGIVQAVTEKISRLKSKRRFQLNL
jgi:hypothetical protein